MKTAMKQPVAVITGAGRGIGAAVARRLAAMGYALGLCDADEAGLARVADELGAVTGVMAAAVDVRDLAALTRIFGGFATTLGGFDVLVNGAGLAYFGGVARCTEDEWTRTLDVNVGGYFRATKAALPHLALSAGAHVVNMSSVWALDGSPAMAAYSASKHAVEGLTSSLRKEVGKSGIKVTSLILDKVDTDFREHMTAHVAFDAEARQRMLAADDVADAVAYVLSTSDRCLPATITLQAWLWN